MFVFPYKKNGGYSPIPERGSGGRGLRGRLSGTIRPKNKPARKMLASRCRCASFATQLACSLGARGGRDRAIPRAQERGISSTFSRRFTLGSGKPGVLPSWLQPVPRSSGFFFIIKKMPRCLIFNDPPQHLNFSKKSVLRWPERERMPRPSM